MQRLLSYVAELCIVISLIPSLQGLPGPPGEKGETGDVGPLVSQKFTTTVNFPFRICFINIELKIYIC